MDSEEALAQTGADGIYINPVVGPKKQGDFLPGPILLSYQRLLEFGYYPKGKAVLGSFFTYSRYAGPREAVFTALCRKNMGCSLFIVGRDHTGVGDFYDRDANRKLFEELGDIGVKPVFFGAIGYNSKTDSYEVNQSVPLKMISGGEVREMLRADKRLPDWFMRDLVQEVLLEELQSGGRDAFHLSYEYPRILKQEMHKCGSGIGKVVLSRRGKMWKLVYMPEIPFTTKLPCFPSGLKKEFDPGATLREKQSRTYAALVELLEELEEKLEKLVFSFKRIPDTDTAFGEWKGVFADPRMRFSPQQGTSRAISAKRNGESDYLGTVFAAWKKDKLTFTVSFGSHHLHSEDRI